MEFFELLELCNDDPIRSHPPKGGTLKSTYYDGYLPWFESYRRGDSSLDKNLKGMIENGLSEEEAFFILAYTSSYSGWINTALKDGRKLDTECKKQFANALDNALEKIKSGPETVYRMDWPPGDPEDVLTWFESKIGSSFVIPYFLSTAKEDYENSEVVWQITTLKSGSCARDISNLCQAPSEQEVLFKRASKFKIIKVDRSKRVVFLDEIPTDAAVDFPLIQVYHKNF